MFDQNKLIYLVFCLNFSCGKSSNSPAQSATILSADELTGRLIAHNEELTIDSTTELSMANSKLQLTLIAEVLPPVIDGIPLQAVDVAVSGNAAYVSYNVAGEIKKGALSDIDISKPSKPSMHSEIQFRDRDINGIFYQGNSIFTTGSLSTDKPAFFATISLREKELSLDGQLVALPSFAGTGIYTDSQSIYVTSGDTGGLSIYSKELTLLSYNEIFDARGVYGYGKNIHVVSGQPGRQLIFDEQGQLQRTDSLGGGGIPQSKASVIAGSKSSLVSLGDGGFKIICNKDGEVLASVPQVTLPNYESAKTVTNAVSIAPGYIFSANGWAGVRVYRAKKAKTKSRGECENVAIELLGTLNFGTDISANNISYKRNTLFVSSGLKGLRIISLTREHDDDDYDECHDDRDDHDD